MDGEGNDEGLMLMEQHQLQHEDKIFPDEFFFPERTEWVVLDRLCFCGMVYDIRALYPVALPPGLEESDICAADVLDLIEAFNFILLEGDEVCLSEDGVNSRKINGMGWWLSLGHSRSSSIRSQMEGKIHDFSQKFSSDGYFLRFERRMDREFLILFRRKKIYHVSEKRKMLF